MTSVEDQGYEKLRSPGASTQSVDHALIARDSLAISGSTLGLGEYGAR